MVEHDPLIGTTVAGRYEVVRKIGRGGMGAIYEIRHATLGRSFAMKTLTGEVANHPEVIARFQREADIIARLRHPNIVEIVDWDKLADGTPCLIMEYLRGEDLAQRLRGGPLAWPAIASLADQVLSALAVAHRAGVVHRDLKPQNIFLAVDDAGEERAKLLDFGVSKIHGSHSFATTDARMIGTPAYMSPEQANGAHEQIGPVTDVWSMGAILFEMATGKVAFEAAGLPQILYRICHRDADPVVQHRADAPPAFVELVAATLQRDPSKRIADADTLRAGLRAALAEVPGVRFSEPMRAPSGQLAIAHVTGQPSRVLGTARSLAEQPTTLSSSIGQSIGDPTATTVDGPVAKARPRRRRVALAIAAAIAIGAVVAALVVTRRDRPAAARSLSRLVVEAHNDGDASDDALLPAVARMAARTLGADRRITLLPEADATADGVLAVRFRRTATGVTLAITATARGRTVALPVVDAASVAEVLSLAEPSVVALAGAAPPRPASDAETARMTLLGATSLEAFDLYEQAVYASFRAVSNDYTEVERLAAEAIRLDPGWLHPRLIVALARGWTTDPALAVLRDARAQADPAQDPRGWTLLEAAEASVQRDHERSATLAESIADPDDPFSCFVLMTEWFFLDRVDSLIGILRRLHDRRPELQFGSDLVVSLSQNGRGDEGGAVIESWLKASPDNEQALASSAQIAAAAGRFDEAKARAGQIRFLFGDNPARLVLQCDVLLIAGDLTEAVQVADRLSQTDAIGRQRARYRLGVIATLQGRFAAAYQSFQDALVMARPLGLSGETTQILEALQSLAWVGDASDLTRWTDELAAEYDRLGGTRPAALARYEVALRRRAPGAACPRVDDALAALAAGPPRNAARPDFLRAAQSAGCASCKEVVAAGRSFREGSSRSLSRFAACAAAEGALDLARQAYAEVAERRASLSIGLFIDGPFEWVLAHYHLGSIEARLGHAAEARDLYQRFVDQWARADRQVPELEDARGKLATPP